MPLLSISAAPQTIVMSTTPTMNTTAFEIYFVILLLSQLVLLWNVRYFRAAKTDQEPIFVAGALGRPIRSMGFLVNLVDLRKKPKQ